MNYEELSDEEWTRIAALVSDEPPIRINRRGRPRAEPRVVANAVLWILTTGESWSRLPARYPSGPTCRRRFDEWHVNGTLIELVRILSAFGRTFVYLPEAPSAARGAVANEASTEDDGLPAVFWKSPEAWQAPALEDEGADGLDAHESDPFARMTQQLSSMSVEANTGDEHASPIPQVAQADEAAPTMHLPMDPQHEPPLDEDPSGARSAVWINDAVQRTQVAEWRGHTMHLTIETDSDSKYRASVEILQDGRRVERSGLVGPPFDDREAALQYAFDWARAWIDGAAHGAALAQAHACAALAAQAEQAARAAQAVAEPAAAQPAPASSAPAPAVSQPAPGTTVPSRAAPAVVTRPAPPAVANMPAAASATRLAPVQRFVPSNGLPPARADGSREKGGAGSAGGGTERRVVASPLRSHIG